MPIRNTHWTDTNEGRSYPLSDKATARTTDGRRLPNDIIADLSLRYPETLGDFPFLASVAVTDHLITLTFQVATALDDSATFQPLAAVTVLRSDLRVRRHTPLQAQTAGVGGWVVLGEGADKGRFYGRLDGPGAGLLTRRAARLYRPIPVTSLAKLNEAVNLTGVVRLSGEQPIEVVAGERHLDGELRTVAVVRLAQPPGRATSVFEEFAGKCGQRPESHNCGEPLPLESIATVRPDCDGNVTVEFRGCAAISQVAGECGVIVECGLGLTDACLDNRLPTDDGTLPNEYPDQCDESASSPDTSFDAPAFESESVGALPTGSLPYHETFDDEQAQYWAVKRGAFDFTNVDSVSESDIPGATDPPFVSYASDQPAARNLSLWQGFDVATLGRRYYADVQLRTGGPRHNAGIVLNRRLRGSKYAFHLVSLDYDTQRLQVLFDDGGGTPRPTGAEVDLAGALQLNRWYRLSAVVEAGVGAAVTITASVVAESGPALSASVMLSTTRYLPDTGFCGLHADRSRSLFSHFAVVEV